MKDAHRSLLSVAVLGFVVVACAIEPDPTAPRVLADIVSQGSDVEPNNTCATAQGLGTVALPLVLAGSLEPVPPASGDLDFFHVTQTPRTVVKVDLEGEATGKGTLVDPLLGIFDSNCNVILLANEGGIGGNARAAFMVPADGAAVLAVTGCCDFGFSAGGSGSYELTMEPYPPPVNDDFASAVAIPTLPFSGLTDIAGGSIEPGEPLPTCASFSNPDLRRTAWYSFTPSTTGSISGRILFPGFPTMLAVFTGTTLADLVQVDCRFHGLQSTIFAQAGTTYYFQVGDFDALGGPLEFVLDVTPPPFVNLFFFPQDPSVFDDVQFFESDFDPGEVGIASQVWSFGDGADGTGCCPTHRYAADGDYTAQVTVTTFDGRTASTSQTLQVRTHDVAITRFSVPTAASVGQTRRIVVGLNSKRYPETVDVLLLKSVPGGFQQVGVLTQSVPVRSGRRTTDFAFSYTFTADDAQVGKVTFRAVANLPGARDALPADNEAIAPPTKVAR